MKKLITPFLLAVGMLLSTASTGAAQAIDVSSQNSTCDEFTSCVKQASRIGYVRPSYDPNYWNGNSTRKRKNNCYNYAANKVTNSFAQPGHASGGSTFPRNRTCAGARAGANSDSGIKRIYSLASQVRSYETAMALVVAPGYDYHWYRRDSNGRWSHKPGSTSVTNRDNSNRIITNPISANRGNYTHFCGYYVSKSLTLTRYGTNQNKGTARISGPRSIAKNEMNQEGILPEGLQAEILLFSGMPNPVLSLDEQENFASQMKNLQRNLKKGLLEENFSIDTQENFASKLGYQGIILFDSTGKILPKGTEYHLYKDELQVFDSVTKKTTSYYLLDAQLEDQVLEKSFETGKITQELRDNFEF